MNDADLLAVMDGIAPPRGPRKERQAYWRHLETRLRDQYGEAEERRALYLLPQPFDSIAGAFQREWLHVYDRNGKRMYQPFPSKREKSR